MMTTANMITLTDDTPVSIIQDVAQKVKARRLDLNLTQKVIAKRAGLSYSTYRKFESSGEISLKGLVMIAFVLDSVDEFAKLFTVPKYSSIDELLQEGTNKKRQRGGKSE
jgi:transcriptional regulator with XRE-family HTH domain